MNVSLVELIGYIEGHIEVMMSIRIDDYLQSHPLPQREGTSTSEQEDLIQKLEADIRQHIRSQLQMKVEQETFKSNVTEMQKLMHQLESKHQ